jgi:hypothetical protein
VTAAALVADLAGDPHRAGVKVDVLWSKGGEFGPAEAGEGGQQDERTVSDQPVFQRRVEDRPEKPVSLGCRYFADL